MMYQSDKYTTSRFFYAIDFDTFLGKKHIHGTATNGHEYNYYQISFPAIWFKRKGDELTVVKGSVGHHTKGHDFTDDGLIEDMIQNMDSRYGGNAQFRWDGMFMWGPEKTWDDTVAAQKELDQHWENFPAIPVGYSGWWALR